jgi:hypothetical protein
MPEELMKPMYTTSAGLLLYQAGSRGLGNGAARFRKFGKLRSRLSDWVRDFF